MPSDKYKLVRLIRKTSSFGGTSIGIQTCIIQVDEDYTPPDGITIEDVPKDTELHDWKNKE